MCVITEGNSTVCGHRASFTNKCKKKARGGGSMLNRFAKECSLVLNSTYHHEICHNCRRFWRDQGVSESEATERTREYRKEKDHHAPLSPETVFYHQGTGIWADIIPDLPMINREENASAATLWPSLVDPQGPDPEVLPTLSAKAYIPSRIGDSNRTGVENITIGMSSDMANTRHFELGNVNKSFPPRPKTKAFERQRAPERLSSRAMHPNLDHGFERPITQYPTSQPQPSNSRMKPDLDKPLPRRPRPDNPMPNRSFDSRNPERDLPANKYYPRFI